MARRVARLSTTFRRSVIAYVFGEILEFSGDDAAAILEISPASFRKRLSRAREDMERFLGKHCGLADPTNRCRCTKLVSTAIAAGVVDPGRLVLGSIRATQADRLRRDIEEMRSAAQIFRQLPGYASPTDFAAKVRTWLDGVGDGSSDSN